MSETFYWHDYETFGANPSRDRPSQFAGIRTDAELNVIGEPLVIYCKTTADTLPHPEACLITGITPQKAFAEGLPEAEFIARIHAEMAKPGTCSVGYNSIRFDDEVTRHALYRNFYDAYAREYKSGNSRWDLIDMVRVCRALRPEGIVWPDHEDGTPSFKLEHLTAANGISHADAHDALSDVLATIELAKLVKRAQPRLFAYLLGLKDKRRVLDMLDVVAQTPLLHTSAMFPASQFCTSLIMPLAMHPSNKNSVICFDLRCAPDDLLNMPAEQLKALLYTRADELPQGQARIAIKTVQANRCPVLATADFFKRDPTLAGRIQLDLATARRHYKEIKNSAANVSGQLRNKLLQVFDDRDRPAQTDPDQMLYSGGFFGAKDKALMAQIRKYSPEQLAAQPFDFEDPRLPEMLFRYRGRNYPQSLSPEECERWAEFCYQRLTDPEAGASIAMEAYNELLEQKMADQAISPAQRQILEQLYAWGDDLLM